MRAVLAFTRAYPGQSAAVLAALIIAGLVEGVSLTALLPALSAALESGGIETSGKSGAAVELRSAERRAGKQCRWGCRSRWRPQHEKKELRDSQRSV